MAIRRFSAMSLANASGCHFGHLFFKRSLETSSARWRICVTQRISTSYHMERFYVTPPPSLSRWSGDHNQTRAATQ